MAVDARIGSEIGGYRIERLLGRGGMSSVYLAEHLRLQRKVALKILAPELAEDERFRERFLRESQLASSLDHPNIVPIFDADEVGDTLYIAMRWVEGTDLRELLRRESPLDPTRSITIAAQAAAGLDAAHRRGLVHRDVKPGNILIGENDHVYVSDFGLTKQASSQTGLTATGQLVGTLDYVAPEQIQGQAVDGRTDVYSLGCVVYECLTGAKPFERDAEVAILWAHMQDPPPVLSEKRPDLPRELDAIFAKGMAKTPGERYATCGELVDALRLELGISSGEIARPATAVRRRVDRRMIAAAVVLVAAAVIGAAFLATRGGGTSVGTLPLNSVGAIDPKTGKLVASIPVGETPAAIAYGLGSVWVANQDDGTVTRIDPKTGTVVRVIGLTGTPLAIAVGMGYVWVTTQEGRLFRIEPTANTPSQIPLRFKSGGLRSTVADSLNGVAAGRGRVWVLWAGGSEILGVDPASGRIVTRVADNHLPFALALGAHTLWVGELNTVSSVDTATGVITGTAQIGALSFNGTTTIAVGEGAVWAAKHVGDVWRIEPATTTALGQATVGPTLAHVAAGAGAVWVARPETGLVARIDPASGTVRQNIPVGHGAYALAVGGGLVWVTTLRPDAVREFAATGLGG